MKRLLLLLATILNFQLLSCFSEAPDLIPVRKDSLWGFCDKNKRIVIQPKYDQVSFFEGKYASVRLNKRSSIIDTKGVEILPFKYSALQLLDNGLIRVVNHGQQGFIDFKGKEIIPVTYDYVVYYKKHIMCEKDSSIYFFDNKGEMIKQYNYDSKKYYDGGCAPSWIAHYGSSVYHDVIPVTRNKRRGCLKYDGNEIVPCIYDNVSDPYNYIIVELKGKRGVYDLCGKMILKAEFDDVESFAFNRRSKVKVKKDGKWGIVDSLGKTIRPFIYDYLFDEYRESEKYIYLATSGKRGEVIDSNGNVITTFQYDTSSCQYLNFKMDVKIPSNRFYEVQVCEKRGIFSFDFKQLVPIIYDEINVPFNGYMRVKRDNKYGYLNMKGDEIIPCKYEGLGEIEYAKHGFLEIFKKNKLIGYVSLQGKEYMIEDH